MEKILNTEEHFYTKMGEYFSTTFNPNNYPVVGIMAGTPELGVEKIAVVKVMKPKKGEVQSFNYPYNRIDINEYCLSMGLVFKPRTKDKKEIIDIFNELTGTTLVSSDFYLEETEETLKMNFNESLVFKGSLIIQVF